MNAKDIIEVATLAAYLAQLEIALKQLRVVDNRGVSVVMLRKEKAFNYNDETTARFEITIPAIPMLSLVNGEILRVKQQMRDYGVTFEGQPS